MILKSYLVNLAFEKKKKTCSEFRSPPNNKVGYAIRSSPFYFYP